MKILNLEASEITMRDERNVHLKESQRRPRPHRRNANSTSSARDVNSVPMPRMFLWTKPPQPTEQSERNIHKKTKPRDVLEKRKTVTALKAGENRAILLGLAMLVCSIFIAFLLGTKVVQQNKSVWTGESRCTVLEVRITGCTNCSINCGSDCWNASEYTCLQVYVNVSSSGMKVLLHQSEETVRFNPECFCTSNCKRSYSENKLLLASLKGNITQFEPFLCYYDPKGRQRNVILKRFDKFKALYYVMIWPSCLFLGGIILVVLVKLTQYLSFLTEQAQ